MKKFNYIFLLLALFLGSLTASIAQTTTAGNIDALRFQDADTQLNILSNQNSAIYNKTMQSSAQQNTVFISQIGDNNTISSVVNSSNTDISLVQLGDNNGIFSSIKALSLEQNIVQNGNNNTFTSSNYYMTKEYDVQVSQNGNNQNLTLFGQNSISEKLKVNMQGEGQTVIVRNFN